MTSTHRVNCDAQELHCRWKWPCKIVTVKVHVSVRTGNNSHLPTTMVVPLCTEICLVLLKVRSGRSLRDGLGQKTYSNLLSPSRIMEPCKGTWSSVAKCLSCLLNKIQRERWYVGGHYRVKPSTLPFSPALHTWRQRKGRELLMGGGH